MTEAGWTRDRPTAAGWYWLRNNPKHTPEVVKISVMSNSNVTVERIGSCEVTFEPDNAEFKGPITPDSYQQGRVACLGDVKRYIERQIKIGEDFIGGPDPNIQRRVALDEVIEYCDRLLAQQAQGEKVVE